MLPPDCLPPIGLQLSSSADDEDLISKLEAAVALQATLQHEINRLQSERDYLLQRVERISAHVSQQVSAADWQPATFAARVLALVVFASIDSCQYLFAFSAE